MFGRDIERVIGIICNINNEAAKQIELLSYDSDYRFMTIDHTHNVHVIGSTQSSGGDIHYHGIDFGLTGKNPTGGSGSSGNVSDQLTYPDEYPNDDQGEQVSPYIIYEKELPKPATPYVQPLITLGKKLQTDITKIKKVEGKLYVSANKLHNSYGSPYTEIYDLKKKIDLCEKYADKHPRLQWLGEKHALLNFIQMVFTTSVDAKFAIITFNDYLQRGYDEIINGKKPSIKWDDFDDGDTIGNIKQK